MKEISILVTGSGGQLGQELQEIQSQFPKIKFKFFNRAELDITDKKAVLEKLDLLSPDFLINAAAYTAVDQAESDEEKAFQVNVTGVDVLAKACQVKQTWLMHVSSDYVYHHNPGRPLLEEDETLAQGVYARTKLKGDQVLQNMDADYCILRTSWVYSSFGKNFVKSMGRLGRDREVLNIVSDQIGTPTYARDLALVIVQMVQTIRAETSNRKKYRGVYNYSNEGVTNWAEFAEAIFKIQGITCEVRKITTEEFGAPAPRPKWSLLDKSKIKEVFGIEIKDWKESLKSCINLLNQS